MSFVLFSGIIIRVHNFAFKCFWFIYLKTQVKDQLGSLSLSYNYKMNITCNSNAFWFNIEAALFTVYSTTGAMSSYNKTSVTFFNMILFGAILNYVNQKIKYKLTFLITVWLSKKTSCKHIIYTRTFYIDDLSI